MRVMKSWKAWGAIAVLAIVGATVVACKSGGTVGIVVKIPGMELNANGTWTYRDSHGRCFEIKFRDSHGNQIGSGSVTNGSGSGTVPTGAATWEAKQVPCPPGFRTEGGGMADPACDPADWTSSNTQLPGGQKTGINPSYLAEVLVVGGPLGFDRASRSHNALYELVVLCDPSTDEASSAARQVVEAPLGVPIPSNVTVIFLAEAFQNATSGQIVSLGQMPFVDFRVELNGQVGYGDLSTGTNAVQMQNGPNLWTVTTNVSYADVRGYDHWNAARIEQRLAGQAASSFFEQRMIIYH